MDDFLKLPAELKTLIKAEEFLYSKHFYQRQNERNFRSIDVANSILNGQVIEHMYSYNRGHKFIIFNTHNEVSFHIVLVYHNNTALLKTIYIPNTEKFLEDLKTRNKQL
ncbi:DUF4258 domain-containing protein [Clostridium perfringens]|uniref:DUF4258 domain-containing protein n=1 Tax=Clostridium perfringens TaxID=1502 RepID=UPI003753E9EC